ncbi:hypothetical protein ACWD7M_16290 [Streptomyces griseus]
MTTELRAYNTQGDPLLFTPDLDASNAETFNTVGAAFDRMETVKSAYRWDRDAARFIRNRIATFRMDDEIWTRPEVAAHAAKRAALKTTASTRLDREHRAAYTNPQAYPLAEAALRSFVRELATGTDLLIRVADGTPKTVLTRDDLHAVTYSGHTTIDALRRVRAAVQTHVSHGTRDVHELFPAQGMRPALYLSNIISVLEHRTLENAQSTARSTYPRAQSFRHAPNTRPNATAGYTFIAHDTDTDVRYGWADGNNGLSTQLWNTRQDAEHALPL